MAAAAVSYNTVDEEFYDYTVATVVEKFSAAIENCLRNWTTKDIPRERERQSISSHTTQPIILTSHLRHNLPFRSDNYVLTAHITPLTDTTSTSKTQTPSTITAASTSAAAVLCDRPHKLQHWFSIGPFLILEPASYSGRMLEEEEAHTLLSAGTIALSHLHLTWPLFIPVQDALRDSYRGIAVRTGTGSDSMKDTGIGTVVKFDTDSVHSSRLGSELDDCIGQLGLFGKVLEPHCGVSTGICSNLSHQLYLQQQQAATTSTSAAAGSSPQKQKQQEQQQQSGLSVRHVEKRSFIIPPYNCDTTTNDSNSDNMLGGGSSDAALVVGNWDDSCSWAPWATYIDPIEALELDVVYDSHLYPLTPSTTTPPPPTTNTTWRVAVLARGYERDDGRRGFVLSAIDQRRKFLKLQPLVGLSNNITSTTTAATSVSSPRTPRGGNDKTPKTLKSPVANDTIFKTIANSPAVDSNRTDVNHHHHNNNTTPEVEVEGEEDTLYGMLLRMTHDANNIVSLAQATGQLVSGEWWLKEVGQVVKMPPEWVLQDALRDIFELPKVPSWPVTASSSPSRHTPRNTTPTTATNKPQQDNNTTATATTTTNKSRPVGKAAPLESLASHLALHAMLLGNPRAVAALWERFLREIRFLNWEGLQPLPRMIPVSNTDTNIDTVNRESSSSSEGGSRSGSGQRIDMQCSLLHQKLQLLDICIHTQRLRNATPTTTNTNTTATRPSIAAINSTTSGNSSDSSDSVHSDTDYGSSDTNDNDDTTTATSSTSNYVSVKNDGSSTSLSTTIDGIGSTSEPMGVKESIPHQTLLHRPQQPLNIPITQEPAPRTEDMLAEHHHLHTTTTKTSSPSPSPSPLPSKTINNSKTALLSSDMQAFKAANPGCCFEDFIRWYSPRDWILKKDHQSHSTTNTTNTTTTNTTNTGDASKYELSPRMQNQTTNKNNNHWQQLWNSAQSIPTSQQRPLFQPSLEAERALHFLEMLPPTALYSELMALGFSAAVELLERSEVASSNSGSGGGGSVGVQLERLRQLGGILLERGVAATALLPTTIFDDNDDNFVQTFGVSGRNQRSSSATDVYIDAASEQEEENSNDEDEQQDSEDSSENSDVVKNQQQPKVVTASMQRLPSVLVDLFTAGIDHDMFASLLESFHCVERTVVAAQSIFLRLGGSSGSSTSRSSGGISSDGAIAIKRKAFAMRVVDGLTAAALHWNRDQNNNNNNGGCCLFGAIVAVDNNNTDRLLLYQIMNGNSTSSIDTSIDTTTTSGNKDTTNTGGHVAKDWDAAWLDETSSREQSSSLSQQNLAGINTLTLTDTTKQQQQGDEEESGTIDATKEVTDVWSQLPFSTEWLTEISTTTTTNASDSVSSSSTGLKTAGSKVVKDGEKELVVHRMFVKRLPGELRVATMMTASQ